MLCTEDIRYISQPLLSTEGTFTWRISSRDDSTRAEIIQCLHDMIRPGREGTCRRSSCSVHPGLSLLHEFILDNALVSEKVGKIVNFEKHDVWPWWEPRKV